MKVCSIFIINPAKKYIICLKLRVVKRQMTKVFNPIKFLEEASVIESLETLHHLEILRFLVRRAGSGLSSEGIREGGP